MLELPVDVCAHFSPYLQSCSQKMTNRMNRKFWWLSGVTEYPPARVIADHATT